MKKIYLVNNTNQTILPVEYTPSIKAVVDFYDVESNIFDTVIQEWSLTVIESENPCVWCYSLYEEVLYGVDLFSAQLLINNEDEEISIVTLFDLVCTTGEETTITECTLFSDKTNKECLINLTLREKNALTKINEFCENSLTWR